MKRIMFFIAVMIISMSFSATVFADDDIDQMDYNDYSHELQGIDGTPSTLRWSYTSKTTEVLSVNSSGTATATASVTGYKGVTTKIVMYMYIQQYKNGYWNNIASRQYTVNDRYALKEFTHSTCSKGYTYRLRCSYYVYSGSNYEHIITYSPQYVY